MPVEELRVAGQKVEPNGNGGEGGPVSYNDLTDLPTTFPPSPHSHAYSALTGLPTSFPPSAHTHAQSDVTGLSGALAGKIAEGDSRLSDARTPTAHQHAAGDITSGVLAVARLGTGTPSASVFLRGDGAWAAPPAGGGGTIYGKSLLFHPPYQ